jgi:hypothetical protein
LTEDATDAAVASSIMSAWRTAAAMAVLASLTAMPLTAAATVAKAPTDVRLLTPLDTAGNLATGYTITKHYTAANCVSGSPTTGVTYECVTPQSAQGVYEGCWVTAQTSYVVCLTKPWSHDVTRLHVTRGYDNTDGFTHHARPWGVRLVSGQRCLLDLDATSTTNGHANTYFCNQRTVLVESVDRTHPVWRARAYRRLDPRHGHARVRPLGWQPIAVAWRTKLSAPDVPTTTSGTN